MALDRRELLAISGAAGIGALAGCYAISEMLGDEEKERRIPDGIETLHIRAGDEHVVAAGDVETYGMIQWAVGGALTMEPDGAIAITEIGDA